MLIFYKQADLISHLEKKRAKKTIGFVPTMGALHEGHLALVQKSLEENDHTVVSIFVNPTQFNNPEDLAKYPRTLKEDSKKLKNLSASLILFAPTVEDMYEGHTASNRFDFGGLENQMEGKFRPGHFDGVGTVLSKFFKIVLPTHAYFGEKDFQQLQIVKKLVSLMKLDLIVVGCPIYRETHGLAMSSRNERLTAKEREEAQFIYQTLLTVAEMYKDPQSSIKKINDWVIKVLKKSPYKLDYFCIADEDTLLPTVRKRIMSRRYKKSRAFIAVFINNVRLIDTISLI